MPLQVMVRPNPASKKPRQNNPTGKSVIWLSSPFRKNIPLQYLRKSPSCPPLSRPTQRGVSRSSRTLAAGCGGRRRRLDEGVCMRTAKSCGPDAPTLASSPWEASFLGMTAARKPGRRGEHEVSRKTTVQGKPECFWLNLWSYPRSFFARDPRVQPAPGFPCAL